MSLGQGYVVPVGALLRVEILDADWIVSVRLADGGSCPSFEVFDGQPVSNRDLLGFAPHYESLEWKVSKKNFQNSSEYHAIDGEFRINLVGKPGKHLEMHEQVGQFLEWMRGGES